MKNQQTQKNLWLLAAIAAPAAHFSGCGWLTAGLTALAVLPLSLLPKRWEGLPRPIALVQILWLGIAAGCLLPAGAVYWPSDNDLAVPLILLALAFLTKAAGAPRVGAVLAFCMLLPGIPLAASGAVHVKLEWMRPMLGPWSAGLVTALLLPSLPPAGEGRKGRGLIAAGAVAVLLAALVQGVISPELAASQRDAFYQTSRTLGYLEPVVAVGVTLGWYAFAALILESARETAKGSGMKEETASVLVSGTAAVCMLFRVQLEGLILAVLSAFFWVMIPFAAKINFFRKR